MIKADWNWLEDDKRGFSRYWVGGEESVWVCQYCEEEADPDEGCMNEECSECVGDEDDEDWEWAVIQGMMQEEW